VCRRAAAAVGAGTLAAVPFLVVLAEADPASAAAAQLRSLADSVDSRALVGFAVLAAVHCGQVTPHDLDSAIAVFGAENMPYHQALARLALARLVGTDDPAAAMSEAATAARVFADLGAEPALRQANEILSGPATPRSRDGLSPREREVLQLLATGLTNQEIATRLFISPKTASVHVTHILTKLQLRNRSEAVAYALRATS